jgi:ABC-type lipoprotein export system ATPase subunit
MDKTAFEPTIRLDSVCKTYSEHHSQALRKFNLTIEAGEFIVVMGPSGCGKSTLLNLIAGIDSPTEGSITIDGKSLEKLSDEELTSIRRQNIGFIFQFFNLLSTLTVEENVALPLELGRVVKRDMINKKVAEILDNVGLANRAKYYPSELSGGEMQRTAVARALVHKPKLLIADEPTGNLDSNNGAAILKLLKSFSLDRNQTIIMATHSLDAQQFADRIIEMKDGTITGERLSCQPV